MKKSPAVFIFPLALMSLLLGIVAGWQRVSWDIPMINLAGDHGALMTGSFMGTLICLERSINHPRKWWRILPFINGLSFILFLVHQPQLAFLLLIAGSVGLLLLLGLDFRTSPNLSHPILIMGAFAWLTGNLVLFNQHAYPSAVKWWMLFLLWTIFGERLKSSMMLPGSRIKKFTLYFIIAINFIGAIAPFHWYGNEIQAVSLILISVWFYTFDRSRFTLRLSRQYRYNAILIMTGYAWLIVAACWMLFWPDGVYAYDATLHSFFLGFVFSMVFAHIPIMFPAIFKINISLYHPSLFLVYAIFQASLIVRIAGDALLQTGMRKWGAIINGVSVLLFFAAIVTILVSRIIQKKRMSVLETKEFVNDVNTELVFKTDY